MITVARLKPTVSSTYTPICAQQQRCMLQSYECLLSVSCLSIRYIFSQTILRVKVQYVKRVIIQLNETYPKNIFAEKKKGKAKKMQVNY